MFRYHPLADRLLDSAIIPKYNLDSLYGTTNVVVPVPNSGCSMPPRKIFGKVIEDGDPISTVSGFQPIIHPSRVEQDDLKMPNSSMTRISFGMTSSRRLIYYPALPNWGSVQFHIDSASNTLDKG